MEYLLICLVGYGALFILDIMPQIKKKNWRFLGISLPIVGLTFIASILLGFGVHLPSFNKMLVEIIKGLGLI